ncbi:MAG: 2-amino-4-oxopentanoate thiolase subunit OrtA [Candidatus Wallbacteria bacterium]|nr:2-amino-4-oxopentanoate thiolase subunit OrtA [Candidatus Wallbacteria bacterium]
MVKKGTFVQIEKMILKPGERAANIPEDTKKVPYMMWVNGFLKMDAKIGDEVEIKTLIGRTIRGRLVAENPAYTHNYGKPVLELMEISRELHNEPN